MAYKLMWKKPAKEDFESLNKSIKKLTCTQFDKLKKSPQLGEPLGNKLGMDLTGFRKLYFNKKRHRIVYTIEEEEKKVTIYGIGKRNEMEAYREVKKRIETEKDN